MGIDVAAVEDTQPPTHSAKVNGDDIKAKARVDIREKEMNVREI